MIALLLLLACATDTDSPAPPREPILTEPAAEPSAEPSEEASVMGDEDAAHDNAERVVARHILIAFDGARSAPRKALPARKEALALAEELRARVVAGESFEELARKYSDDTTRSRGGFLGSGSRGSWVEPFEKAVFALKVGEVSEVVESPFGFHIIRREPLDEVRLRQIVVQFSGARAVGKDTPASQRTRGEAEARMAEARARLAAGESFEQVALAYSDGPMAKRGGDLGWFLRGELGPAFDAVAFELPVGGVSDVVETPFGLHVIERLE